MSIFDDYRNKFKDKKKDTLIDTAIKNKDKPKKETEVKSPPKRGSKNPTRKGSNNRANIRQEVKDRQLEEMNNYTLPKFVYNASEGLGDALLLGQVSKAAQNETDPLRKALREGTSAKVGRLAGEMVGYALPFQGAAPVIGKATARIANPVARGVANSVIGDATIGLAQNIGLAKSQGLEGNDFVKDVALNTGLDLALGGAMEVAPALRSLRGTSDAKFGNAVLDPMRGTDFDNKALAENIMPPRPKKLTETAPKYRNGTQNAPVSEVLEEVDGVVKPPKQSGKTFKIQSKREKAIRKQVDDFANGKLKNGTMLDFGDTPKALLDAGANQRHLEMSPKTLKKIISPENEAKHGHDLGYEGLIKAIKELENPVKVIKSATQGDSIIAITRSVDKSGNTVIVPIKLDANGQIDLVNKITSAYGKRDLDFLIESAEKSGGVLLDNKNRPHTSSVRRLQLPKAESVFDPIDIIPNKSAEVNTKLLPRDQVADTGKKFKDLGADVYRKPKTVEENRQAYGTYGNEAETPLRTDMGKVSQGAATIEDYTLDMPEEARKAVQEGIEIGDYFSRETKNADFQAAARDEIARSIDDTRNQFFKDKPTAENIIRGIELGNEYARLGDYENMERVFSEVSNMTSEAGRSLQAMRLFKSLSPEGRIRTVRNAVERLAKQRKVDVKISDNLYDALKNATTEKEVKKAREAIFKEAWDQIPSNWQEKLEGWRYLSMLGNPRTHIRNITGNLLYVPVRTADDIFTNVMEKAFKKRINNLGGKHTRAFVGFTGEDKELRKYAKAHFAEMRDIIMGDTSKYIEKSRPQDAKLFNNKILDKLNKMNSDALEAEDRAFMGATFESAFTQYCKANGKTVGNLSEEFVKEATEFATDKALRATYRDKSALASWITKQRKKLEVTKLDGVGTKAGKTLGGIILDSALPFKKTPINILKRAAEHTPPNIINGAWKMAHAKDAETFRKGLEAVAEGMTGTGILGLGLLFGSNGWANGSMGDYDQSVAYKQMLGEQEYSLNVGGYSITVDWAAPASMPFFVGVEIGSKLVLDDSEASWDILDSVIRMADPMFEMSMLDGINQIFEYSNSDGKNPIFQTLQNAAENLVGQYIPTLSGQIARTTVENRKTTVSTAENSTQRSVEKLIQRLANKIPGLTNTSQDYVDIWGRTDTKKTTADYVKAGLENFLSPAYIEKKEVTDTDKEILRLMDVADNPLNVLPANSSYDVSFKGTKYHMNEADYTQFKKDRGSKGYELVKQLQKTDAYKKMSDKEKSDATKECYDKAFEFAKENYLVKSGTASRSDIAFEKLPGSVQKAITAAGVDPVKAASIYEKAKGHDTQIGRAMEVHNADEKTLKALGFSDGTIESAKKLNNLGVSVDKYEELYEKSKANDANTDLAKVVNLADQDSKVLEAMGYSAGTIERGKALSSQGITGEQYETARDDSDKDGNGSIKKDEAIAYLNKRSDLTRDEKRVLFKALCPTVKKIPY